jgi:hypothetical protein
MVENLIICCTTTKQNINKFFMIFEYMKVCVLIILCKLHIISNKIYTTRKYYWGTRLIIFLQFYKLKENYWHWFY